MKKSFLCGVLFLAFSLGAIGEDKIPAFPGAEGWGRYATGGRAIDDRGSNVFYVTRLDDCEDENLVEGTLRWALRTGDDTPRTILFKTCGTIILTSKLKFEHPNVTIAGQSAPGGGVCISGANVYVCKDNVIIQHVRFRAGDEASSNYSAIDIENCNHIMIDHCSFSWSMEENVTMYDNDFTTMQWCIISEPLYYSRHKKGERGYGSQWGGEHSSYHHNLFAHCVSRGPRFNGARDGNLEFGTHDQFMDTEIVNNVMFNWGKKECTHGGECTVPEVVYTYQNRVDDDGNVVRDENNKVIKDVVATYEGTYVKNNLVNNYYKPGPATEACADGYRYFARVSSTNGRGTWYASGNYMEANEYKYKNNAREALDRLSGDYSAINKDNWANAATSSSTSAMNLYAGASAANLEKYRATEHSMSGLIELDDAAMAYKKVVRGAGCSLPYYDEVDKRILAEAAGLQTPKYVGSYKAAYIGVIDSQNDLKPADADATWIAWPSLAMAADEELPVDTDDDGIPDNFEIENGLNPADEADGARITDSGYSNLELFLHSIQPKTTSIETTQMAEQDLVVLPNRSAGILSVSSQSEMAVVSIFDVTGKVCGRYAVSDFVAEIPASELSQGILFVQVQYKNGARVARKVVW